MGRSFRKESDVRARPSRLLFGLMVMAAAWGEGCANSPRARLTDCERLIQAVRTENAQLKDVVLKLRTHNHDLAQRSVDDAKRIRVLEKANRRLEQSVLAYQDERDRLATAFEQFKSQLQAAADPTPTALRDGTEGRALTGAPSDSDNQTELRGEETEDRRQ
jgi:hypothetical protein